MLLASLLDGCFLTQGPSMIHIKEHPVDRNTVSLDIGGVLDQGAIPVLEEVCGRHLDNGRDVVLNLEAVVHITREGRAFVQAIRGKVGIANLPEFMKLADHT
jgi:hypothetical protein